MKRLFSWIEIPVENFERAVDFYNTILRIKLKVKSKGDDKMAIFPDNEGVLLYKKGFNPTEEGIVINIDVGDRLDETLQLIEENGGTITRSKSKIESSDDEYFALFKDTEGNRLGLNGK